MQELTGIILLLWTFTSSYRNYEISDTEIFNSIYRIRTDANAITHIPAPNNDSGLNDPDATGTPGLAQFGLLPLITLIIMLDGFGSLLEQR